MPASRAVNPREPVVRVPAFQKALDDALFEQPLQAPLESQVGEVVIGALGERTCAWVDKAALFSGCESHPVVCADQIDQAARLE